MGEMEGSAGSSSTRVLGNMPPGTCARRTCTFVQTTKPWSPPPPSRLAVLNVLRARCFVAGHDAPDGMAVLERVGQPRLAR